MAIRKKQKISKKDITGALTATMSMVKQLEEKMFIIESILYKYIDMEGNTDIFNRYLQDELESLNQFLIKFVA